MPSGSAHEAAVGCGTAGRCWACGQDSLFSSRVRSSGAADTEVLVCPGCGHATRRETRSPEANLALQAEHFADSWKRVHLRGPTRRRVWDRYSSLYRHVVDLVGSPGSVLDIGCGTGAWLARFADPCRRYGVEIVPEACDIARQEARAEIFCGPFDAYGDAPERLDVITAFALAEHLLDPRILFDWAAAHLRPGGLFVVMTGDRASQTARKLGGDWPLYSPWEHVHFFSGQSLTRALEASGLKPVRAEWRPMFYSGTPFPERLVGKMREVLGLVRKPRYDHLYVYARSVSATAS